MKKEDKPAGFDAYDTTLLCGLYYSLVGIAFYSVPLAVLALGALLIYIGLRGQ